MIETRTSLFFVRHCRVAVRTRSRWKKREGTKERKREKRLPQGRCNYCTSWRLFEYVRTIGTNLSGTPNGGTRQYSSSLCLRRTLTAAWPRERPGEGKRYTALKSTFSLLNFIGRRRRTAIPSYRAAIVVFMMGIPVTAKCSAMQRGPDHPPNSFLPIDRDDFYDSQVADRPSPDHKAPDSTWVSDGNMRCAAWRCNATQCNETRNVSRTHESRTGGLHLFCASEYHRGAVTREFVFVMRRQFKNDLHS